MRRCSSGGNWRRPCGGCVDPEGSPEARTRDDTDSVVDPANLDWNLLLADLRKLSTIVENKEEENTAYEKAAAPTVRQKQPVSNHSRL